MKEVLFISYDGLLDPLGKSQILPYIFGLSDNGYKFCLLSFEKNNHKEKDILKLKSLLKSKNIKWYKLTFVKGKFQGIKRIIKGAICVRYICSTRKIKLIHLRAILPGIIYFLSFINKKYIYDIRAFAGQWVDSGAIKKSSILEKFLICYEKYLINNASGLVILDPSCYKYLKLTLKRKIPYKIIPTATDLSRYSSIKISKMKKKINFVFLGGASFPYLPFEALNLVKQLIDLGFDCYIDFINKGQNKLIYKISDYINFPTSRLKIFESCHEEIPSHLIKYDCGLVFISNGDWLKMCSPTKIGEYLASGLFVISLDGINVLNRLAKEYECIGILRRDFLDKKITISEAMYLVNGIQNPKRNSKSRELARNIYDLEKAIDNYSKLYEKVSK